MKIKLLGIVVLMFLFNISIAQELKPISSISAGGGLNYNGTMQMNLNLIVHNAYGGYTTDTFNNIRTMEIGWLLQHKKANNWYLIPTLGMYTENSYNYSIMYIHGVSNDEINGTVDVLSGKSNFNTLTGNSKLMSEIDNFYRTTTFKPCYGLVIGYYHKDITFLAKVNNKEVSIGVGCIIH